MSISHRKIISTAPGRAGIIGNPSDMYGGAVISCSIKAHARVTITPHATLVLSNGREQFEILNREGLELRQDRFDIVRAILQYLGFPEESFRVEFESSVPFRSGLSGSTALLTALMQGMLAWQKKHPDKHSLAEMARFIEYHHLKIVCGFQDAYMCVFGGLNFMDFNGKRFDQTEESDLFAMVESIKFERQLPFILATTGVERVSGAVHKPLAERWQSGENMVVQGYERIAELAHLGKKAIVDSDWTELGELMNENHRIQCELAGCSESNEQLILAALDAGALGAKLAGAGEGGTIIVLYPEGDGTAIEEALRIAGASAVFRPAISPGATLN